LSTSNTDSSSSNVRMAYNSLKSFQLTIFEDFFVDDLSEQTEVFGHFVFEKRNFLVDYFSKFLDIDLLSLESSLGLFAYIRAG